MKPIATKDTNMVLTLDECHELPAQYKDGVFTTLWKLSKEDIRQIKATGMIALHVWGETHPPIAFSMIDRRKQNEPK